MRRSTSLIAAPLAATAAPGLGQSAPQWPAWADLSQWTDISEEYRSQFTSCDTTDRFRGIQLPQTIGGRRYYPCSSDPSRVTVLRRSPTVPALPRGAVAFTSKLAIDLDGSWFACHTPGHTDQCPTSLTLRDAQNREVPVSSDFIPYVVMPRSGPTAVLSREFQLRTNVRMGDAGVVLTPTQVIPVLVADGGPFSKLGEGSIALHRALGRELCATKNGDGSCRTMRPRMAATTAQ